MFRNVIGGLAEKCFVIAPDLPGFGASPPVDRPSFEYFADIGWTASRVISWCTTIRNDCGLRVCVHAVGNAIIVWQYSTAP
jgi:pimeloyl-ACP methyl ester carboxylesterase